jgi:hypothetical protein
LYFLPFKKNYNVFEALIRLVAQCISLPAVNSQDLLLEFEEEWFKKGRFLKKYDKTDGKEIKETENSGDEIYSPHKFYDFFEIPSTPLSFFFFFDFIPIFILLILKF